MRRCRRPVGTTLHRPASSKRICALDARYRLWLALWLMVAEGREMLGFLRFGVIFAVAGLVSCLADEVVELRDVEFRLVERPGSGERWYEVSVNFETTSDPEAPSSTGRFVDDVRIELALGIERDDPRRERFAFFTSQVAFVSLEAGRHAARFYLPPEIVSRDRIRGAAHSFEVAAFQRGVERFRASSRNLDRTEYLNRFRALVDGSKAESQGILRPQHRSPFELSYPDDTPTARLEGTQGQ